jgi:hypothetical protein
LGTHWDQRGPTDQTERGHLPIHRVFLGLRYVRSSHGRYERTLRVSVAVSSDYSHPTTNGHRAHSARSPRSVRDSANKPLKRGMSSEPDRAAMDARPR